MGWNGFILRALLLLAWVCADTVGAVEGPFQTKVQPFLRAYCVECHNADKAKADFRLDDIKGAITAGRDTERWEKALEMLSIGDMPPEKAERQPPKAQLPTLPHLRPTRQPHARQSLHHLPPRRRSSP